MGIGTPSRSSRTDRIFFASHAEMVGTATLKGAGSCTRGKPGRYGEAIQARSVRRKDCCGARRGSAGLVGHVLVPALTFRAAP